jgi:hypothetical protein
LFPSKLEEVMGVVIDCDTCAVRGLACHDCVVTVLLGPPPESGFGSEEERALAVLADSGLVPRLRMVRPVSGPGGMDDGTDDGTEHDVGPEAGSASA